MEYQYAYAGEDAYSLEKGCKKQQAAQYHEAGHLPGATEYGTAQGPVAQRLKHLIILTFARNEKNRIFIVWALV